MSERLPIKVDDEITLSALKMDMWPQFKTTKVIKIVRRYDPHKAEGYNRIVCKEGIFDERNGKCLSGDKYYRMEIETKN
jgi:hypothetical protein